MNFNFLDKIYLGDTMEHLRTLPDACVDLVVSSPPYNIGKEYEYRVSLDDYIAEQRKVIEQCHRLLKPTGSIFWQVGSFSFNGMIVPLDVKFFPIFEKLHMKPRNRIIWIRQHGLHAKNKFSCRHETILWFTKSDEYVFNLNSIRVPQKYKDKKHYRGDKKGELSCNPEGKNPGDIWLFRNVKHNHEEQTIHPCQFPEDLVARIILSTTNSGDTVLDPFMGTGTVAVVARDHNRRYIGAELEPTYHDIAQRRLIGTPDENGAFPNLKTLRAYVKKTGEPLNKFKFAVQLGKNPTDSTQSKIHSEEHHKEELERRLTYEEEAFSAKIRGHVAPEDYFESKEQVRSTKEVLPLLKLISD